MMVNLEPTVVDKVRTMPVTRRLVVATMPCTCSSPKMVVDLEPTVVEMVRAVPSDETIGGGDDAVNMFFSKNGAGSTSLVG